MFYGTAGVSGLAADPPLLRPLPLANGGTRLGGWMWWARYDTKIVVARPRMRTTAQTRELDRL